MAGLEAFAKNQPGWIIASDNYDGLHCSIPQYQGWFLLRVSLHESLMPLNIESDYAGGVGAILSQVIRYLETRPELDVRKLKK